MSNLTELIERVLSENNDLDTAEEYEADIQSELARAGLWGRHWNVEVDEDGVTFSAGFLSGEDDKFYNIMLFWEADSSIYWLNIKPYDGKRLPGPGAKAVFSDAQVAKRIGEQPKGIVASLKKFLKGHGDISWH